MKKNLLVKANVVFCMSFFMLFAPITVLGMESNEEEQAVQEARLRCEGAVQGPVGRRHEPYGRLLHEQAAGPGWRIPFYRAGEADAARHALLNDYRYRHISKQEGRSCRSTLMKARICSRSGSHGRRETTLRFGRPSPRSCQSIKLKSTFPSSFSYCRSP